MKADELTDILADVLKTDAALADVEAVLAGRYDITVEFSNGDVVQIELDDA